LNFKTLSKSFTLFSAALLGAASLAGIAGTVNAESSAAKSSNGAVTIHAQQATPPTPEDNMLGPNDGSPLTSGPTMANVTFKATPITPKTDASAMVNASGIPDPAGFTIDTNRSVLTQTTDAKGNASFTGLSDGYYLFHQFTTAGGIRTIQDFIVTVNTKDANAIEVNVYPKLSLSPFNDLQKIALTDAADNFNGKTPDQISGIHKKAGSAQEINPIDSVTKILTPGDAGNVTTAASGNTVTWNVNSIFDPSQVTNVKEVLADTAGSYQIKDTLPDGVSYSAEKAALIVNVADASGNVIRSLVEGTDYIVVVADKLITITLTTPGQLKTSAFLDHAAGQLNIQIPTNVDAGFVGTATNSVVTTVVNAFGVDISHSTAQTAGVNVGGVEIEKVDAAQQALSGATFVLVRAKDEAAAKALIIANADKITNDGSVSGLKDAVNAEFVKDATNTIVTRTTGTDGLAAWTGLNLVDENTDATNTSNYYAVEIKSPAEYTLPSPMTAANVTPVTADTTVTAGQEKVVNSRTFNRSEEHTSELQSPK
jgi:hypothetical protein